MRRFYGPGLLSYLFTGAIALVTSLVLSGLNGCYWGNREIDQPATSWFYEITPQSLTYTADGNSVTGSTGAIPSFITQIFTDPVYVTMYNSAYSDGTPIGNAIFLNNQAAGSPIFAFNLNGSSLQQPGENINVGTWDTTTMTELGWAESSTCPGTVVYFMDGTEYSGTLTTGAMGVSGRLNLTMSISESFEGNGCSALMASWESCLTSANCDGTDSQTNADRQAALTQMLAPYGITAANFKSVQNLTYEIVYN